MLSGFTYTVLYREAPDEVEKYNYALGPVIAQYVVAVRHVCALGLMLCICGMFCSYIECDSESKEYNPILTRASLRTFPFVRPPSLEVTLMSTSMLRLLTNRM